MQTITNGVLEVSVNEKGSIMDSVKLRGEEYLWQGSEQSWKSKDIVIFPFVARLKDGWYLVDGKRYEMKNHGLARYNVFDVAENAGDSLTLRLSQNDEMKLQYPFDFVFTTKYTLSGNTLTIGYKVENRGAVEMPFGLGVHAGWQIDGTETETTCDTSGNFAVIETDKPITEYEFDDDLHLVKGEKPSRFTNKISLEKATFAHDAVVTKNSAKKVSIIRKSGKKVIMDIGDAPVLAVWSNNKFGKYACLEPWWGLPDTVDCNRELKDKFLIQKLAPNSVFYREIKVTLE